MEEAAQAIAGRADPCRLQDRLNDGDQGWWIIGDGQVVGALCSRLADLNSPVASKAVIWTWLAIDARWRAYGYGGASVPLLERAAREAGASIALTPLPPDNGVALYFWLRLGYTPLRSVTLRSPDWPDGVAPDALWMRRPLEPDRSDLPLHAEE
ncbi:MAG: GNAT family N-acetyltransferase [Chloroflexi bacterium]|nr:GNAT family N-acetyltransferase [Chloroflexota bacterium]